MSDDRRESLRPQRTRRVILAVTLAIATSSHAGGSHAGGSNRLADVLDGEGGVVAACETTDVDFGEWWARAMIVDGVRPDERDQQGRSFVWTGAEATLQVWLSKSGLERTIAIVTYSAAGSTAVDLRLNGVDLGQRSVGPAWHEVSWTAPASALRVGRNLLELTVDEPHFDSRWLGVSLDRLTIRPGAEACERPDGYVPLFPSHEPTSLPAGAIVSVGAPFPPRAKALLLIEGEPGASVRLFSTSFGEQKDVGRAVVPASGRGAAELDLDACCDVAGRVDLVADGPLTVRRLLLTGDESPFGWRWGCLGRGQLAIVAAILAGCVLLVSGARRGWSLPFARASPWLDPLLVLMVAAAVRWLFRDAYPAIDHRPFGDSWEYLRRARILVDGASVWRSTEWHAWQTWSRPPGFYLLLGFVLERFGSAARLADVYLVLSSVTAAATCLVARPLFGRGAALAAGLIVAFNAESIVSIGWILTEPLFLCLLTVALAGLASTSVHLRSGTAFASGLAFGLTSLVRTTPVFFVPTAGLTLLLVRGRSALRPALALVAGLALAIAPWCLRNSLIAGAPTGIDNIAVANFLQVHPDDRFIMHSDLDLETAAGRRDYYDRVKIGNRTGSLAREPVLASGLVRLLSDPVRMSTHTWRNLKEFLQPFPETYPRLYLSEERTCRVVQWQDALNLGYLLLVVGTLAGLVVVARIRPAWPIALWLLFNVAVINVVFYPDPMPGRFRLHTLPVAAVLTGAAVTRGLGRLRR